MDIETSGVVMHGECDVHGERCTAKEKSSPITAVWTLPGRNQINVCHNCLTDQVKKGEWKIAGSRVPSSP